MSDSPSYTVPQSVQRLVRAYEESKPNPEAEKNVPKFKISEAIGRVAFFYEKIRNAVDYQEDNLLIKSAIERIIKRKFLPGEDPAAIAQPLLTELIRGGYIANNVYPEVIVEDVAIVLTKYANFLGIAIPNIEVQEQREELFDWAITMLSCELEDVLQRTTYRQSMIDFVYITMLERVKFSSPTITEDEKKVQIYIASLRAHAKYDAALTSFHLLKFFYPEWSTGKPEVVQQVAQNALSIKHTLERQYADPLQDKLIRQIKKINIMFVILHDVLRKHDNPLELLQNTPLFEEEIELATKDKYKEVKGKLRRTSVRSIIYLFVTKMFIALILELPYDLLVYGHILYLPLAINVTFHPLLLMLIALLIHIPAKENTNKIIEGIKDMVYDYEGKEIVYAMRTATQRSRVTGVIFKTLYALTYIITFGFLIAVLSSFNFTWLGTTLFILFLTLVSFFGLRVRQMAKDLVVLDRRDNIISATIDFFSIPVVRAGHWLSESFSKINVFVFILDVIIEAPFKLIIDIFEDWLGYIREKREELY